MRIQDKCLVPIYVFPEMKLCSLLISKTWLWIYNVLSSNSYTHISVRNLYIPGSVCLFCFSQICGPILEIYKSLTSYRHTNVEIGTEAAQFPEKEYINGIFVAVLKRKSQQGFSCMSGWRHRRIIIEDAQAFSCRLNWFTPARIGTGQSLNS